jgi:2-haloacid dehalogenase
MLRTHRAEPHHLRRALPSIAAISTRPTSERTMTYRPKYITFDCYGTLTNFRINDMPQKLYGDQLAGERLQQFVKDFGFYRFDEATGDWKPYDQVLKAALQRTCKRHGIAYRDEDGQKCYEAVPSWGPHADVPEPLTRVGNRIPLVILSNAMNEQIMSNVRKLEAPFHKVFTAQDAGAYKPRLQAFEYMLDQLGCAPEEILHVSSSPRYDLMSAHDLGIVNKVFVNRGHEPKPNAAYTHSEIRDISGLPALVGL